jgi:hypothetical protein
LAAEYGAPLPRIGVCSARVQLPNDAQPIILRCGAKSARQGKTRQARIFSSVYREGHSGALFAFNGNGLSMRTKKLARAVLGVLLLAMGATTPASAQMLSPGYGLMGAPMSNFLSSSYLTQSVANDLADKRRAPERLKAAARDGVSASVLVVKLEGSGLGAARLSAAYPTAQQGQAREVFEDLLRRYGGIERQFGLSHGDFAGAVVALLAGSWMALHDAEFPDAHFLPAVRQMRALLATQPALRKASESERRAAYEQMAIIGMFMAGTQMALKQQPDARVRQEMQVAARGYLQQFLGSDAERLHFTAEGIALR